MQTQGEHSEVDCYIIPQVSNQCSEPNITKRTCQQRNNQTCCIIDLSRWCCRAVALDLIGPDPDTFP